MVMMDDKNYFLLDNMLRVWYLHVGKLLIYFFLSDNLTYYLFPFLVADIERPTPASKYQALHDIISY